jgi:hypothetical protein
VHTEAEQAVRGGEGLPRPPGGGRQQRQGREQAWVVRETRGPLQLVKCPLDLSGF